MPDLHQSVSMRLIRAQEPPRSTERRGDDNIGPKKGRDELL